MLLLRMWRREGYAYIVLSTVSGILSQGSAIEIRSLVKESLTMTPPKSQTSILHIVLFLVLLILNSSLSDRRVCCSTTAFSKFAEKFFSIFQCIYCIIV